VARGQGIGCGVRERVAADDDHPGVPGAVGLADHADLAGVQERRQAFGLGLQVRHLPAGRDADAELLAGPGELRAGDPWDAVVAAGEVRMPARQRPAPAQVRAEQRAGERVAGPVHQPHHDGGRDHQPVSPVAAQVAGEQVVDRPHQPDES
jgi:hypothetical protein